MYSIRKFCEIHIQKPQWRTNKVKKELLSNHQSILKHVIIFVALLFFATSLVFAKKDKDKDGDRGSRNLRIVAAEPDLEAGTLLITGFNLVIPRSLLRGR